jgi:hypothetical protein
MPPSPSSTTAAKNPRATSRIGGVDAGRLAIAARYAALAELPSDTERREACGRGDDRRISRDTNPRGALGDGAPAAGIATLATDSAGAGTPAVPGRRSTTAIPARAIGRTSIVIEPKDAGDVGMAGAGATPAAGWVAAGWLAAGAGVAGGPVVVAAGGVDAGGSETG